MRAWLHRARIFDEPVLRLDRGLQSALEKGRPGCYGLPSGFQAQHSISTLAPSARPLTPIAERAG
jgi:hypothetical protein